MPLYQLVHRSQILGIPLVTEGTCRLWRKVLNRQSAVEETMHAGDRIADRHRMPGVSVIASADRGKVGMSRSTPRQLILDRHLECYLYRHRPAVGVEEPVYPLRKYLIDKELSQLHCRAVSEAAKHNVRQLLRLLLYRPSQSGVAVSVDSAPPGAHPVDQFSPILQRDHTPLGGGYRIGLLRVNCRGVGVPEVCPVPL